ncbi:hypothetical protein YDYSG_67660 [Paenibacillus tyrfis]|uniref:hypothetical protein n=1 Tax=Paenibacillus tyrfis TaxID=1501230 RepID=UPI002491637B|nr:hypothetical protein [Paenibacillus tyrfis]GLI10730.1 hypothetical protein YDYSG_67660 [Paenibacillus tyrfis]
MNVVFFGEPGGEEEAGFPLLPDWQVLVVSAGKKSGKKNGISYVPLSAVRELEPSHGVAVVSHPYWMPFLRQWKPYAVIGLAYGADASSDASFHYYRKALNRFCDAVLTDSEEAMLDLSLRGIPAFHSPGPLGLSEGTAIAERCAELVGLCKANADVYDLRRSIQELAAHKRTERTEGLLEAIECEPHNEALITLAARYLYAEGRHSEAEYYGFQAFGRCVVASGSRCLSLYRWIAMVQARQGKTEDALNSFGVTAIQAEDKARYQRLLAAYDQQLHALVCADICRENGDMAYALELLERHPTPFDRSIRYQLYKETDQYSKALDLLAQDRPKELAVERERWLLLGEQEEQEGCVPQAVSFYLKAACIDQEVISNILRLEMVERFLAAYS